MKALFLPFREAVTTQRPGIVWNVSYTFHDLIDLAPTSRYLTFGYPTRKSDERGLQITQGLKRSNIKAGRIDRRGGTMVQVLYKRGAKLQLLI